MSTLLPLILRDVQVRRRGRTVIGPVDLTISPGGPTIVLGPNGAGKTTLLRAMHGVERINAGTLEWQAEARDALGFVAQTPIMLRRSVADNLAYPLQILGRPKPEVARAVAHWIQRAGLKAVQDAPATRLSGGERQKLAIARALIRDPEVLFLDEPCASLDGHATAEIEALLGEVAAAGTRIIMATHNMGQARRLARDVIFLVRGRVHEVGDANILEHPATPELQAFLRGDIVR